MSTEGVSFPTESTSAAARTILSMRLRKADPVGSRAVENETNWRRNYLNHFRLALEAGIGEATAPSRSLRRPAQRARADAIRRRRADDAIKRHGAVAGVPHPYGHRKRTSRRPTLDSLSRRAAARPGAPGPARYAWVDRGVITQSCSEASRPCRRTRVAAAEGDTSSCSVPVRDGALSCAAALGRRGVAIDSPRPDMQERVRSFAEQSASRVHVPPASSRTVTTTRGDLVTELSAVAHWLGRSRAVGAGNYCYAGTRRARTRVDAADALAAHLTRQRPKPRSRSARRRRHVRRPGCRGRVRQPGLCRVVKIVRAPLRMISGGRLLQRNYPPAPNPRRVRRTRPAARVPTTPSPSESSAGGRPLPGTRAPRCRINVAPADALRDRRQ